MLERLNDAHLDAQLLMGCCQLILQSDLSEKAILGLRACYIRPSYGL